MFPAGGLLPLKVTDLKQYLYCPRIIYFTYVTPVAKKITPKMQMGKDEHFIINRREARRKLRVYGLEEGERRFNTHLFSARLGLEGVLDVHVVTPRGNFPVDYKNTCRVALNHKYQLAAYALLLEEHYGRPIRGGFIYLIPRATACYLDFTPDVRLYTRRLLGAIRNLVAREVFPAHPRRQGRCTDCEYRNFCGDVR